MLASARAIARDAYHLTLRRDAWEHRQTVRRFFGEFVGSGDLVFDVGANDGRYTDAYLALGARVIAVEPHPDLAALLRRRYHRAKVEEVAIGEEPGSATLHIGTDLILSTLSSEWMTIARREGLDNDWVGTVTVRVRTLDSLIDEYGVPDYVKIDVEGYEPSVLRGLSHAVQTISFEFQSSASHFAEQCIDHLGTLGDYEFNVSMLDRRELDARWVRAQEMARFVLGAFDRYGESHGDIFARLASYPDPAISG